MPSTTPNNPDRILEGKKVLVTGGAGFIGSNLIEDLLKHGNSVICMDNFLTGKRKNVEPFQDHENFELVEGDITDFDTCLNATRNVDVILHQAALGSVPRSIADPLTTNRVNVDGFLNMLEAARQNKIKRFVYAASSSAYGDSMENEKIEHELGRPLSPYSVSKLANELYADVFGKLYGVEPIGLRYFNVFGRRQDPDGAYAAAIPKFIKRFINHESPVIYGDGTQSRDFTYIDNVIKANHLAATTDNPDAMNEVFNVAYGERTVLNDVIEILKEELSSFDPEISKLSVQYEDPRPGDIKHSLASIDKAKELLGYDPDYSFREGISEAIKWYWDNLKND